VILEFELAKMYHFETKYLKRTVKNNLKRFPSDFIFELTQEEWDNMSSQIATSCWGGQIIENRLIENFMTKKFPPQRREFI
jgi:hypothetical protein